MCGGIAFKINSIPKSDLEHFFGAHKTELFLEKGQAESKFWDSRPILPVKEGKQTRLFDWGNRDKGKKLPLTGWAKQESLDDGKWAHLSPEMVCIPATRGYEKGVWFDIDGDLRGIKVALADGTESIYMVTEPANPEYIKKTGHNREPVIVKS